MHSANAAALVAHLVGDAKTPDRLTRRSVRGRAYAKSVFIGSKGQAEMEFWTIEGGSHAWSGDKAAGSHTDANSPDSWAQVIQFFLERFH